MQRNALRAVALAALMVLSVFAGVPLASEPATADDDTEPFDQIDTHDTGTDEFWLHSYAAHDGELFVAGALEDQIYVFDSEIDEQRTYDLDHEPAGLARFDGSWIVSSGEDGTLERYDDEFEHVETVVDSGFEDESTSPWNIDDYDGKLYVADGPDVAVFDDAFAEVDRFETDIDPVSPLSVVDGHVYVLDNDDDPVYAYTTDGEYVDSFETGVEWDLGPGGMGYWDGSFYAADGGDNDDMFELSGDGLPEADEPVTVSGSVDDQHGNSVADAHVIATGVADPGGLADADLPEDPDDALAALEDPIPEAFDADYDLESHTEIGGTYALVHDADAWGVGTTHIADSSVDEPSVTVDGDGEVILSLWDATADGGWVENQVDQSFPGATTEGTIVVEQLGPSGDTLETRTYDTEPVAETTGVNPLTTTEHHGVQTTLPTGIYHVYPEGDRAAGYVVSVGDPDEIAAGIVDDLRDDAGEVTDRAAAVADLRDDEILVRETTQADSDGEFELEVPEGTETVHLDAMAADGLEDLSDPSLEDLRDVRADGFNGSVVVPAPGVETAEPPAEDVTVDVYRTPEVPFDDLERYADLSEWLEDEFLDSALDELEEPFETPLEDIDDDVLEGVASDLENLSESNDDLADAVGDLDDIDDVGERVDELYDALDELESIDPGEREGEIDDGEIDLWQAFPEPIEDVLVTVEYDDGTVERVPAEYVEIESDGLFGGDRVSVQGYDVGDRGVADVSIEAVGEASVGSTGVTLENPAVVEDFAGLEALRVSSPAPGPDERVSVDVRGSDVALHEASVLGTDGEDVDASVEGERVTFDTDGVGVHTVALSLESDGHEYQVVERLEAVETSRSDPPTVRVSDGVAGEYAVINGELEDAEVAVAPGEIDVTAVAEADDVPGSVHVQPESVLEGSAYDVSVSVEEPGDEPVRSHVETVVHFPASYYDDETITWRNSDPVTFDGSTRFGDVQPRPVDGDAERKVVFTYTDERGELVLETDSDPSVVDRVRHWGSTVLPRPTLPFV